MKKQLLQYCALTAVAVVFLPGTTYKCWEEETYYNLINIARTMEQYNGKHNAYPESLELLKRPDDAEHWYIIDPWDTPLHYKNLGSTYELYSYGFDRAPKTLDDVHPNRRPTGCSPTQRQIDQWEKEAAEKTLCDRAIRDLDYLESWLWGLHEETHRYLSTLLELNNFRSSDGMLFGTPSMFIDPWGEPYAYNRMPTGYELYSTGADRIANTADDIVFRNNYWTCRLPPYDRPDLQFPADGKLGPIYHACGSLAVRLKDLVKEISEFRDTNHRLPITLAELYKNGNHALSLTLIDPWGEPISYQRSKSGYTVFSKGSDRKPNTEDDLKQGFPFDACAGQRFDSPH
ncbi:MAG: type II secretion system protein GspG [Polyangiaceae bacterium]|nr:type II secretion system protein GspG [Polyangiaceae bacterium]